MSTPNVGNELVWWCTLHDTYGTAATLNEAQHVASAHLTYWADATFESDHPTWNEAQQQHEDAVVLMSLADWDTDGITRWAAGTLNTLGITQ